MEKDTVAMYFVNAAVATLADDARTQVLVRAGIQPELLALASARVSAGSFARLWLAVGHEMDDEFFGLDQRRMKVGSFALLSQSLLTSGDLARALRRCLRGFALFLDDVSAELAVADGVATVSVHNQITSPERRLFADETFLVMVHGLMCWLIGRRIPLTEVAFAAARPPHAGEHAVMYTQALAYGAAHTRLQFDAHFLAAPVVQNADTVRPFLRNAPQSVFLKYKNEDSWTARLRRQLRSVGGTDWPLLDDMAEAFHVAPTTLRRRLESEGTSYQGIKDQLRRDAAIHHLCHTTLGIAEIAHRLGFQEPSAFHRAFKKWTGAQPGEYRMQQARSVATRPGATASRPA